MASKLTKTRIAPPSEAARRLRERGIDTDARKLTYAARNGRIRGLQLLDGSCAFDVDQLDEDAPALVRGAA